MIVQHNIFVKKKTQKCNNKINYDDNKVFIGAMIKRIGNIVNVKTIHYRHEIILNIIK